MDAAITGDLLTVRGERRDADTPDEVTRHRAERPRGRFERSFSLPMPVRGDGVKATYRDGVLSIRLPKADDVKAKQITIEIQ
jgi:HSP20 family protein